MKLYGWTEDQLDKAATIASKRIGHGTKFKFRDLDIISYNCNKGGETIKCLLRFSSSTCRRKDGSYPPGILIRERSYSNVKYINDPIPLPELVDNPPNHRGEMRIVREYKTLRRSCGAPCWHAFGHFFRACFELVPNGKIVTAKATYDTENGFEYWKSDGNIGSMMDTLQYSSACDCSVHGTERF